MTIVLDFLIIISGFFDYWIMKSNENGQKIRALILNVVFTLLSALLTSTVLSIIILFIYIDFIDKTSNPNVHSVLLITTLITGFWMLLILYLNWKNDINLPQLIVELVTILIILKGRKKGFGFIEMSLFIILSVAVGTSLSLGLLYNIANLEISPYIATLVATLNLMLVVVLYSEFSIDEIERSIRQLNLWIIMFGILCILTLFELKGYIVDNNSISFGSIGLLIVGLIYNVATIADKTRMFIKLSKEKYNTGIANARHNLREKFSNKEEVEETVKTYNFAIQMWKNGGTETRIKMVMIFAVTIIFMIAMFRLNINLAWS